jgi:hypothetical protein
MRAGEKTDERGIGRISAVHAGENELHFHARAFEFGSNRQSDDLTADRGRRCSGDLSIIVSSVIVLSGVRPSLDRMLAAKERVGEPIRAEIDVDRSR